VKANIASTGCHAVCAISQPVSGYGYWKQRLYDNRKFLINSILSDKAEERRVLFEEAAGIGKYKERRRDSLRQLDRTRQDLLRINDKVQEADRQVRMLARHVEKANRYNVTSTT